MHKTFPLSPRLSVPTLNPEPPHKKLIKQFILSECSVEENRMDSGDTISGSSKVCTYTFGCCWEWEAISWMQNSAVSHGASDFVPKPYKAQISLHRVASNIRLRETAAMINQFQYDRLTGLFSKEFFYQQVREILQEYPERQFNILYPILKISS